MRCLLLTLVLPLLLACSGTKGTLVELHDAGHSPTPDAGHDAGTPPARTFQMQLTGDLDDSFDVDTYIVDIDYPKAQLTSLRSAGRELICHFSAGTWESFRDDADSFPDAAEGNTVEGHNDEQWLDTRDMDVRTLMFARLSRAKTLGCNGVLPANMDGYLEDTGFALTQADSLAYAKALGDEARRLGLSSVLAGDGSQVAALGSEFEIGLSVGCIAANSCNPWQPFHQKTLFAVEFGEQADANSVCAKAKALGLNAILKHAVFDAFRAGCE